VLARVLSSWLVAALMMQCQTHHLCQTYNLLQFAGIRVIRTTAIIHNVSDVMELSLLEVRRVRFV
jgi:hypothetical protein